MELLEHTLRCSSSSFFFSAFRLAGSSMVAAIQFFRRRTRTGVASGYCFMVVAHKSGRLRYASVTGGYASNAPVAGAYAYSDGPARGL